MGRARQSPTAASSARRRTKDAVPLQRSVNRRTTKGVPVRLDLYERLDDGIAEGWVVDMVEAHTDKGPAGYLKLSFVPSDQLQKWMPTPFHYAVVRNKVSAFGLFDTPESQWGREETLKALSRTDRWVPPAAEQERRRARETASDDELLHSWQQRKEDIGSEHQQEYEEFCAFHLDRPLVDYSRVYEPRDTEVYDGSVRRSREGDTDFRRLGVATSMYETAAVWLHSRGLRLHASGLQQPEAAALWQGFRDRGLVVTEPGAVRERHILDAEKLLAEKPELTL